MEKITSVNNDRVKKVVKIMSSPKERKYSGKYMVEGLRMVREVKPDRLDTLFMTQQFFDKHVVKDAALLKLVNKAVDNKKSFIVSELVLRKLANTDNPQGIVALVNMKEYTLEDIMTAKEGKPLILIVERLQDPGNMGTIIRTAEGAGVTGILVSYDSVDIYSPKVVRSTMGSIFRSKIVITYDLKGDIEKLKKAGITIFGMHLDGRSIYDEDLTVPAAFLIGNEGAGLTEETSAQTDKLLRIPMLGKVESLNAAASATIVSYEALRQRINSSEMFFL